ncbi:hypothetical protein AOA59_29530, partial [Pseudomonas sp. 2822-15]|uniref:hypothetical protein n=1 Tax=Pseudomonas sp. 2822-15 TaxID=1712677 RepID=UPI000C4EEA70
VIDCVFQDIDGKKIILDYKTDTIEGRYQGGFDEAKDELRERYKLQLSLYRKALESIWEEPIDEAYLFFFDGAHVMKIEINDDE